eukprot:IDg12088t1
MDKLRAVELVSGFKVEFQTRSVVSQNQQFSGRSNCETLAQGAVAGTSEEEHGRRSAVGKPDNGRSDCAMEHQAE